MPQSISRNCAAKGSNSCFVPAGHGSLVHGGFSQTPLRSGLPSAVRGTGALKFGFPSRSFGTPCVGYGAHWAESAVAMAASNKDNRLVVIQQWLFCAIKRLLPRKSHDSGNVRRGGRRVMCLLMLPIHAVQKRVMRFIPVAPAPREPTSA